MYHNKDHWYRYLILNIPSGNSMLGTLWHKGGGLASWIGGGDWADPLSENSFPFDISGTVSSGGGGGVVASIGGCGDVALDALGDLPTWLEEDMTGLHGPTASEAMSTRNLDPGLEVPDPMDARSMALRFRNIKQVSVHFFFLFFCSVVCYFCREREWVSVIDIDIVEWKKQLLLPFSERNFSYFTVDSLFSSSASKWFGKILRDDDDDVAWAGAKFTWSSLTVDDVVEAEDKKELEQQRRPSLLGGKLKQKRSQECEEV